MEMRGSPEFGELASRVRHQFEAMGVLHDDFAKQRAKSAAAL
jgi:hypothetical protein